MANEQIILAVKDEKVGFNPPFINPTEGAGIRAFGNDCNKPDSPLNMFPQDYTLWKLGTFETFSGKIELCEAICIAKATQYVKQKPKEQPEGEQ